MTALDGLIIYQLTFYGCCLLFFHEGGVAREIVFMAHYSVSPMDPTFSEGVRMSLFYSAGQTYSVERASAGLPYPVER
jgi:hypothetical protein